MWQNDVIPILVDLLSDSEEEVQANAAGALMHATVTTEGKARVPFGFPRLGGCGQEGRVGHPSIHSEVSKCFFLMSRAKVLTPETSRLHQNPLSGLSLRSF